MNLRLLPQILCLSPRLLHRRVKNFPHCRTSAGATEKCLSTRIHTRIKHHPLFYTIKVSQFPQRFIHDEFAFAEAPRKQSQLATHPRKLKLWSRKQRGRPRGRQVGLEENYIGVFANAHVKAHQVGDTEKRGLLRLMRMAHTQPGGVGCSWLVAHG